VNTVEHAARLPVEANARWPRVTLVTPVFNQAEYVAATIRSVLAQEYPSLEYVVIDDGSTDETSQVLASFGDHIRHVRQDNAGQARTLNRGWKAGSGEFLGYLSSDDCLLPGALCKLVAALQGEPRAAVAYCDFELIDAAGNRLRECRTEDYSERRLAVDLVCQPGPGALFRRAVLDSTGGWREDLRQVPDFEFWLRARHAGPFVRVPLVLAQYRVHGASASYRRVESMRSEEIIVVVERDREGQSGAEAREARAKARVLAARSHAHSGRFLAASRHLLAAAALHPQVVLRADTLRLIAAGVLRRLRYRLSGWVR
jgi:glycosyltransferase involved in cell wall biosynthesis